MTITTSEGGESAPLVDFGAPGTAGTWFPVDDVVMGGLSRSRAGTTPAGALEFAGEVSLEDGGGFASVRGRNGLWSLDAGCALRIRYRGDGKTYKLRVSTSTGLDGVRYEVAFSTRPGEWETRTFVLDALRPVFRGRPVPEAGPLDPSHITFFGFLISDGQAGPFRLEVASIEAVDRSTARGR